MAKSFKSRAKSAARKTGRKLDALLGGFSPEYRRSLGFRSNRAVYRLGLATGHAAAKRKNPADALSSLAAAESTAAFRQGVAGDLKSARDFYLAGYLDGYAIQQNPKAQSKFEKCVKEVTAKGGAYDPRAVCAAAGRKKLGQAEMTRRAVAGKNRASRRVESKRNAASGEWVDLYEVHVTENNYRGGRDDAVFGDTRHKSRADSVAKDLRTRGYEGVRVVRLAKEAGAKYGGDLDGTYNTYSGRQLKSLRNPKAADRGTYERAARAAEKRGARAQKAADKRAREKTLYRGGKRNPRNPLDTAQAAYEGFHGEPGKKTVVVQERTHFHTHVWALGPLVLLKVWLPRDRREEGLRNFVKIEFDYESKKPVFVTANEKRNQMFFDGGDQSVDLKVFSVPSEPHETVVLGEVSDAWYYTTKKHLGNEGGTAIYKHKLGEEGGELPTLIYHVLDKRLSLAGGSYTIPDEGIRN